MFLEAVKEAEGLINTKDKRKPLRMNVDYFFAEANKNTAKFLSQSLRDRGYSQGIDSDIKVINKPFEEAIENILQFIRTKTPRNGRSLFFLDQYGFTDVPAPLVRRILSELPAAEIILTFAVDSFINFASDSPLTTSLLKQIGIPDVLRGRSFAEIKKSEKDFRLCIQSCLYRGLVEACGATFYTPFFIKFRTAGHGDYWLVHLSQHPRARDVMARVHWTNSNNFIHYGRPGIEMFQALGYNPKQDDTFFSPKNLDASDGALKNSANLEVTVSSKCIALRAFSKGSVSSTMEGHKLRAKVGMAGKSAFSYLGKG